MSIVCPGCRGIIYDNDTIQQLASGEIWHAICRYNFVSGAKRRATATPRICKHGTDITDGLCWECEHQPVRSIKVPPPICYHLTETFFKLEIPVEALATLTPDAHTRMLAMLNDWITRHKPPTVGAKP